MNYLVATTRSLDDKRIFTYNIVNISTNDLFTLTEIQLKEKLRQGVKIENIRLENNELRFISGSVDRYDIWYKVDMNNEKHISPLVIIGRDKATDSIITYNADRLHIEIFTEQNIISKNYRLANAKVVNNKICAIDGTIPTFDISRLLVNNNNKDYYISIETRATKEYVCTEFDKELLVKVKLNTDNADIDLSGILGIQQFVEIQIYGPGNINEEFNINSITINRCSRQIKNNGQAHRISHKYLPNIIWLHTKAKCINSINIKTSESITFMVSPSDNHRDTVNKMVNGELKTRDDVTLVNKLNINMLGNKEMISLLHGIYNEINILSYSTTFFLYDIYVNKITTLNDTQTKSLGAINIYDSTAIRYHVHISGNRLADFSEDLCKIVAIDNNNKINLCIRCNNIKVKQPELIAEIFNATISTELLKEITLSLCNTQDTPILEWSSKSVTDTVRINTYTGISMHEDVFNTEKCNHTITFIVDTNNAYKLRDYNTVQPSQNTVFISKYLSEGNKFLKKLGIQAVVNDMTIEQKTEEVKVKMLGKDYTDSFIDNICNSKELPVIADQEPIKTTKEENIPEELLKLLSANNISVSGAGRVPKQFNNIVKTIEKIYGNDPFLVDDSILRKVRLLSSAKVATIYKDSNSLLAILRSAGDRLASDNYDISRSTAYDSLIIAIAKNKLILCSYIGKVVDYKDTQSLKIENEVSSLDSLDNEFEKGISLKRGFNSTSLTVGAFEKEIQPTEVADIVQCLNTKLLCIDIPLHIEHKSNTIISIIILPNSGNAYMMKKIINGSAFEYVSTDLSLQWLADKLIKKHVISSIFYKAYHTKEVTGIRNVTEATKNALDIKKIINSDNYNEIADMLLNSSIFEDLHNLKVPLVYGIESQESKSVEILGKEYNMILQYIRRSEHLNHVIYENKDKSVKRVSAITLDRLTENIRKIKGNANGMLNFDMSKGLCIYAFPDKVNIENYILNVYSSAIQIYNLNFYGCKVISIAIIIDGQGRAYLSIILLQTGNFSRGKKFIIPVAEVYAPSSFSLMLSIYNTFYHQLTYLAKEYVDTITINTGSAQQGKEFVKAKIEFTKSTKTFIELIQKTLLKDESTEEKRKELNNIIQEEINENETYSNNSKTSLNVLRNLSGEFVEI